MKFKNIETNSIIEIPDTNIKRIEKLKGYPDKFEIIEEKAKKNTKLNTKK